MHSPSKVAKIICMYTCIYNIDKFSNDRKLAQELYTFTEDMGHRTDKVCGHHSDSHQELQVALVTRSLPHDKLEHVSRVRSGTRLHTEAYTCTITQTLLKYTVKYTDTDVTSAYTSAYTHSLPLMYTHPALCACDHTNRSHIIRAHLYRHLSARFPTLTLHASSTLTNTHTHPRKGEFALLILSAARNNVSHTHGEWTWL